MHNNQQTSQKISNLFDKHSAYYDQYSQQIKQQYFNRQQTKKLNNAFLVLHSDYLNLQITADSNIKAKSTFHDGDIIMEIRGFTVKERDLKQNLNQLGRNKAQYDGCYGTLLWLNLVNKILIKPKSVSEILIKSSLKYHQVNNQKQNKWKGNCYIQPHYGSKLLVKANDIIPRDEQIILDENSIQKFIYK